MGNWSHDLILFLFAVLAHWQALATGGIVTAFVGIYERRNKTELAWQSYAFIMFMFCLYSFFAAWQDEHRNTGQVAREKSDYASQLNSCQSEFRSIQGTLRDKQSLADTLQKAFTAQQGPQAQQAANIASCINNLVKMNPQIREHISVVMVPIASMDLKGRIDPGRVLLTRYMTELFVLTNIPENQFHGILKCANRFDFQQVPQILTEATVIMTGTGPPKPLTDNSYEIRVDQSSTQWNPSHPAFMRVIGNDKNIGSCTFTPIE